MKAQKEGLCLLFEDSARGYNLMVHDQCYQKMWEINKTILKFWLISAQR